MANENEITLTPQGKKDLEDELAYRQGEGHNEIVERLKEARSFGDLSENSEYDAAKEEEAKNESRINEIRHILANAKVVTSGASRRLVVELNTNVTVLNDKGQTVTYTIVGTTQAKSLEHKISNESPMGAALMGHEKGDEVSYLTPSGKRRSLSITDITRA